MIIKDIIYDIKAIKKRDPAARNSIEILLLYQGLHAIIAHRFAHWFYNRKLFFIARLISQISRFFTLIEIHPGAKLGKGILIDHGTGVVIGETAIVGDDCTIYQGVTLGALSVSKDKANHNRHPKIEDNVVIYSGATILGGDTIIGHDSIIGGNVWLTESIEPYTRIYYKSEMIVKQKKLENNPIFFDI